MRKPTLIRSIEQGFADGAAKYSPQSSTRPFLVLTTMRFVSCIWLQGEGFFCFQVSGIKYWVGGTKSILLEVRLVGMVDWYNWLNLYGLYAYFWFWFFGGPILVGRLFGEEKRGWNWHQKISVYLWPNPPFRPLQLFRATFSTSITVHGLN